MFRHLRRDGKLVGHLDGLAAWEEVLMSALIEHTVADLKAGRETWRVFALLAIPSFLTAVGVAMMHAR